MPCHRCLQSIPDPASSLTAPARGSYERVPEKVEGLQPSAVEHWHPKLIDMGPAPLDVMTRIDGLAEQTSPSTMPRRSQASNKAPFTPILQKLGSVDRPHVEAHLLRLDATDRRMRFCGVVSDRSIVRYCEQIDWSRTIGLGCFIGAQLSGMAELKLAKEAPASIAELAITVEPPFQNKGIGTALLRRILTIARNRLVGRVTGGCSMSPASFRQP